MIPGLILSLLAYQTLSRIEQQRGEKRVSVLVGLDSGRRAEADLGTARYAAAGETPGLFLDTSGPRPVLYAILPPPPAVAINEFTDTFHLGGSAQAFFPLPADFIVSSLLTVRNGAVQTDTADPASGKEADFDIVAGGLRFRPLSLPGAGDTVILRYRRP